MLDDAKGLSSVINNGFCEVVDEDDISAGFAVVALWGLIVRSE